MEKLIRIRANYKGQVTAFINYVEGLSVENFDPIMAKVRYDNFLNVRDKFENVQIDIELLDDKSMPEHAGERANFDAETFKADALYRHRMAELSNGNNNSIQAVRQEPKLKLPTIEVPKFDGDITKYRSFRNVFNSVVHNNESLTDVHKLVYLRSSMVGEASELISNLEINNNNYAESLQILDARFDNKRSCIQAHLKLIFEQNSVKYKNVNTLRKLIDDFTKNLAALKTLGEPVENWDSVMIYVLLGKLDIETREMFEVQFKEARMPTLEELLDFLQARCVSFESLGWETKNEGRVKNPRVLHTTISTSSDKRIECSLGHKGHKIYRCEQFRSLTPSARFDLVKKHNLCINCLDPSHTVKNCTFRTCGKCGKKHNLLLHFDGKPHTIGLASTGTVDQKVDRGVASDVSGGSALHSVSHSSNVLLYTAILRLKDIHGRFHPVRGVIDPGSQVNVITERVARSLNLKSRPITGTIDGFGRASKMVSKFVDVLASANVNDYSFSFQAFVLPEITEDLPREKFRIDESFSNIRLADTSYNVPNRVEFLLSNAMYTNILKSGIIPSSDGKLKAINTEVGYLVGGLNNNESLNHGSVVLSVLFDSPSIDSQIEKFWEIENVPSLKSKSEPDVCEEFFSRTTKRDENGYFCVQLPFRDDDFDFSFSRKFALNRFSALEKRFRKCPNYKRSYVDFMNEYKNLSHMSSVPTRNMNDPSAYYIPHHGIFKSNMDNSKIRVVFDGSSCPDQATSLNKALFIGPKLQNDIVAILTRFRFYPFCFIVDIEKMYRMIKVQDSHRKYQRILWRANEDEPLQEFELSTVTYGLTSSPFLAIRCLKQLAWENSEKYPDASRIISEDSFVDDVVSGFNSVEEGLKRLKEIVDILESANFRLHKWNSNSVSLLSRFSKTAGSDSVDLMNDTHRVLGILWHPTIDKLSFSCKFEASERLTKRSILSQLACIFDPLGMISPCVVLGKLIMQDLWKEKLDWDDDVSQDLRNRWIRLTSEMEVFRNHHIDRFVGVGLNDELHFVGFSDASIRAYGACIYVEQKGSMKLIAAKSRVAPIQNWKGVSQEISIARLELLGALTLCRLAKYIRSIVSCSRVSFRLYTDSKIVLCWLSKNSSTWKPFVANRVFEIQDAFAVEHWNYIPGASNPADMISRGAYPKTLVNNKFWWEGPSRFSSEHTWGQTELEAKKTKIVALSLSVNFLCKFSSYLKYIHVFAYVLRFLKHCKISRQDRSSSESLTFDDMENSRLKIIQIIQNIHFTKTIARLRKGKCLSGKDQLSSLHPFIDDTDLLRVGGRLKNADVPYSAMHPIILPKYDHFVKLLIEFEHEKNQHANVETLITILRQRYWIVNARSAVRKAIFNCYRCFRAKPTIGQQLMGELPRSRVELVRPFLKIGIDYSGPLNIRPNRKRGNTTFPCYVAVFVCFATKAVHLETVLDLTTESFISTLRRFIARRGKPLEVWSDNATNFVGAHNEFRKWHDLERKISDFSLNESLKWHFIPPRSPNFGGLWERTVRSMKNCLFKCVGNCVLSVDEFQTMIVLVESALNSRPLCQVTNSPDNLDVLTPGHFLIGGHLKVLPENSEESSRPLGGRWKRVQDIFRQFWDRWSHEYLMGLNQRVKHKTERPNIEVGMVGVLVSENASPLEWPLAKVIKTYPGDDGLVRTIDVKCNRSIYKRGVQKFCVLPNFS